MSYFPDDEQTQIDFFDALNKSEKKSTRKVIGGIYRYPDTNEYAMFYNNALFFIEENMPCLDIEVVITSNLDDLEFVEGYALAGVKVSENEYQWQIRNSGRKHSDDYIIAQGSAGKKFMEQINKYSKF